MTKLNEIPMPGDDLHGYKVIASTYRTDEEYGLLLLAPTIPYYAYATMFVVGSGIAVRSKFENIVPAAQYYQQETGCW